MNERAALESRETDIQGWYRNNTAEPVRVRLSISDGSVSLHTLSGRLIACWSLARLQNREIPVLGERWVIGDRQLPEAVLELENDRDYAAVREVSAELRPLRTRLWRQLGFAAIESGNLTGWPVFVLVILASLAFALWCFLPL